MKRWQHVILGTRCSWLHGDPRGFRARNHRIHSSGDYKNPPPKNEHIGLRRYYQKRSALPVDFDLDVRLRICREFVRKMLSLNFQIIACSVGKRHLHALVELLTDYHERRKVVGKCKQKASHALRFRLSGSIWSGGAQFKRIKDLEHLRHTYNYIRERQEPGTVVWSHRRGEDWIEDETIGPLMMGKSQTTTRIFAMPQTRRSISGQSLVTPSLRYSEDSGL